MKGEQILIDWCHDIPHKPSFTLEEGIFKGLYPAFVQWYIPLEQADVPRRNVQKDAYIQMVFYNEVQSNHKNLQNVWFKFYLSLAKDTCRCTNSNWFKLKWPVAATMVVAAVSLFMEISCCDQIKELTNQMPNETMCTLYEIILY